jgi:iron complex transport system substrate-binding protein
VFPPRRIVCLTEETVETLYLLGEQDRIVGISGYVVRPPQARREKPRMSAFTSANIDKILALKPDLVLTFSDLQADIAADLISSIPFAPSDGAASTTKVSPAARRANRRSRLRL